MRKILIATHSTFAEGITNSVKLLVGDSYSLDFVNAYVDDTDFTIQIDDFFANYQETDEYIVFTDLFGGSVNQKIFQYKADLPFFLITGFNLPVVLEIVLQVNKLTPDLIQEIILNSRNELKLVEWENSDEDEEAAFF